MECICKINSLLFGNKQKNAYLYIVKIKHKPLKVKTMTQQEFETRAIPVSYKEFESINEVYMNSELDKDAFCNIWCKMNPRRVQAYKEAMKKQEEKDTLKWEVANIARREVTFDESCQIAFNFFTPAEQEIIEKAGIEWLDKKAIEYVNNEGVIGYISRFKTVMTVMCELRMFIKE